MVGAPGSPYRGRVTSTTDALPAVDPTARRLDPGAAVRALWARKTWQSTIHVLLDLPMGIATFTISIVLIAITAGLAITAIFAIVSLWLLMTFTRAFTWMERSRFRGILEVDIPPLPRPERQSWWRRFLTDVRSGSMWRQVAYHLVLMFTGVVGFGIVAFTWSVGILLSTLPLHSWLLPTDPDEFGWDLSAPWKPWTLLLTLVGFGVLLAAPWVARAGAEIDVALARWLLGPSRNEELSERVEKLAESRAGVVDAADSERRRIERDLHDGTQQRLVSLAMNLGMARARMADAPAPAREAIEKAHEEAKAALTELRDFVRGLHPAVLNDRGLDAALSGVAARAPIPVQLRVGVAQRPSPTIEAVAYFVVSEALANVAKHARASRAEVAVTRIGNTLRVVVADDGRGGASAEVGSGLRGLGQRVASVDGTLRIDSPQGGPTVIMVELPCES